MNRLQFITAAAIALPAARFDAKDLAFLREQLSRVRALAERYCDGTTDGVNDLHRIAQWLADQWRGGNGALLHSP